MSLLLPQLLRGENDSRKQSDEFLATRKRNCHNPIKPKTFFCPVWQQKKRLHVHRRPVSVRWLFWKYWIIFLVPLHKNLDSGEGPRILGRFPGEGRDILIPYLGRVILFSSLNWKSPPPLPPANFWQVPKLIKRHWYSPKTSHKSPRVHTSPHLEPSAVTCQQRQCIIKWLILL